MTEASQLPDPEKVKQTVAQMRQVCRQFDVFNLALDELIAQVEADIRHSPLTAYRLGRIKPVPESNDASVSS